MDAIWFFKVFFFSNIKGITKEKKGCEQNWRKLDACKDELNTPQCGYSNGQCCGNAKLHFCTECQCKDPRNDQKRGMFVCKICILII